MYRSQKTGGNNSPDKQKIGWGGKRKKPEKMAKKKNLRELVGPSPTIMLAMTAQHYVVKRSAPLAFTLPIRSGMPPPSLPLLAGRE